MEVLALTKEPKNDIPRIYQVLHPILLVLGDKIKNKRALSIGPGGGAAERKLIAEGWDVVCVDVLDESDDIMREMLTIDQREKYTFVKSKATDFVFDKFDKFDLILASNSLPFDDKNKVLELLSNIDQYIAKGGILAFSMFGYETGLVKRGGAFGANVDEIKLKNFELEHSEHVEKKQSNGWMSIFRFVYSRL